MNITNKITPSVIQAATAMLSPYVPEVSPSGLIAALRAYSPNPKAKDEQKPYTRKEVAELLGVSIQSVNRYIKKGYLEGINISSRLVRITPASVKALLNGKANINGKESEVME